MVERSEIDEEVQDKHGSWTYYYKTSDRSVVKNQWAAILGFLFCMSAFGLCLWGYLQCLGWIPQNLYDLVNNGVCDPSMSDLTDCYRNRYFAWQFGLQQLCDDDIPVSIYFMTVAFASAILDLGCFFYEWRLRIWSINIHRAFPHEEDDSIRGSDAHRGDVAMEKLLSRISDEVDDATYRLGPTNPVFEKRPRTERKTVSS